MSLLPAHGGPISSTEGLRETAPAITPPHVLDAWPKVSERVVRRLRRGGVERMTAEDLASEAIAKALTKQVAFESVDHLFNWTMLVTRNLLVDQRRAAARAPEVCTIEDDDVPTQDTAVVAEHRMQLRRVFEAMAGLSADDRRAVMSDDATPADRKEAVRLNVRRHRARARLRAALAGVAALLGLRRLPRTAPGATVPVALATALVGVWLPFTTPVPPPAAGGAGRAPVEVPLRGAHQRASRAVVPPAAEAPRAPGVGAHDTTPPAARRAAPRAPEATRIARAEVGDGTAYVDARREQNRADEHLLCVESSRLGKVCVGRPLL